MGTVLREASHRESWSTEKQRIKEDNLFSNSDLPAVHFAVRDAGSPLLPGDTFTGTRQGLCLGATRKLVEMPEVFGTNTQVALPWSPWELQLSWGKWTRLQ